MPPPPDAFAALAELFRAVGTPLRLRLLARLADGPVRVTELSEGLGESQPLVSHHLGVLRAAGLVRPERRGRTVTYALTADPVAHLVVAALRRHSADTAVGAPELGHVAVPHDDHVDYCADGRFLRLRGSPAHWSDCEAGAHRPHRRHPHVHGADCGHVGVPHGDHVDYVHNGHRHAWHGDHYDDH